MKIDYKIYRKYNLYIPCAGVVFCLAFMVIDVHSLIVAANIHSAFYIFSIAVMLFVIIGVLFSLRHGIHLVSEKEQAACDICGKVKDVTMVQGSPRYYFGCTARRAVWLHIGEQRYYMVDTGEIAIGDFVRLRYLPRSRFVLEYCVERKHENEYEAMAR